MARRAVSARLVNFAGVQSGGDAKTLPLLSRNVPKLTYTANIFSGSDLNVGFTHTNVSGLINVLMVFLYQSRKRSANVSYHPHQHLSNNYGEHQLDSLKILQVKIILHPRGRTCSWVESRINKFSRCVTIVSFCHTANCSSNSMHCSFQLRIQRKNSTLVKQDHSSISELTVIKLRAARKVLHPNWENRFHFHDFYKCDTQPNRFKRDFKDSIYCTEQWYVIINNKELSPRLDFSS